MKPELKLQLNLGPCRTIPVADIVHEHQDADLVFSRLDGAERGHVERVRPGRRAGHGDEPLHGPDGVT